MFKEPVRRGSLRSLRSAPLLSAVLESTLSLTRIHPITSLELPGVEFDVESLNSPQLRSAVGGSTQEQLMGRVGPSSIRRSEHKRSIQHKR